MAERDQALTEPTAVFAALAEILYSAADSAEVYSAICSAAVELIPGCDHASLMLRRGNTNVTVAASDEIAEYADDLERATGEGRASTPSTRRRRSSSQIFALRISGPSSLGKSWQRHPFVARWGSD